jgi:hypothetical protein
MKWIIENLDDIPKDLEPGVYCTRLVDATWSKLTVRMILPPQLHVPGSGCCLIQLTQTEPKCGHIGSGPWGEVCELPKSEHDMSLGHAFEPVYRKDVANAQQEA